jgi:hypothetical protein
VAAVVAVAAARVRRSWIVVPVALVLQGVAMLVVEHADGFWLPLWLDMIIGMVAWALAASLVRRR